MAVSRTKRAMTSLFMVWGFSLLSVTGIVLYIEPQGRIAYWTDWTLFGFTKGQWGDVHTLGGLMFLIAGLFHVYFNWKPLKGYLTRKRKEATYWPPILISALATLILVAGTAMELPPFHNVMTLGASIKDAWVSDPKHEPPFGHAEEVALQTLCKKTQIPLKAAIEALKAKGIEAKPSDKILDLARANGLSPMALFAHIEPLAGQQGDAPKGEADPTPSVQGLRIYKALDVEDKFAGSGIGNKTLGAVAGLAGQSPAQIKARVKAAGLEIAEDEPLKKAAGRLGLTPLELMKVFLVDGYTPQK